MHNCTIKAEQEVQDGQHKLESMNWMPTVVDAIEGMLHYDMLSIMPLSIFVNKHTSFEMCSHTGSLGFLHKVPQMAHDLLQLPFVYRWRLVEVDQSGL